jgi:hypothetical protein
MFSVQCGGRAAATSQAFLATHSKLKLLLSRLTARIWRLYRLQKRVAYTIQGLHAV